MTVVFEQITEQLISKGYAICQLDDDLSDKISNIFAGASVFFALSAEEKNRFSSPGILEGFRGMGIEYSQTPARPDLNDSFSVWKRNINKPEISTWGAQCLLHKAMTKIIPPLSNFGNLLFESLLLKINPSGQHVSVSDYSYLQVNFYEPNKYTRDFLQDAHEDGHLLTVVTSTAAGLEILIDDEFHNVPLAKKTVLLMPGSILTLITGGLIKPLYHRVKNNRAVKSRESLMFFINPSLADEQKPWIVNEINRDIDIRSVAISNSTHFGLPEIDF
jgi:isopenicillin N synthase-like dioxygenase